MPDNVSPSIESPDVSTASNVLEDVEIRGISRVF